MMGGLPDGGEALLTFKSSNRQPLDHRWGQAAVALDDPDDRLAELKEFDCVDDKESSHERRAAEHASAMSGFLRAQRTADPQLQPFHKAIQAVLNERGSEPTLPVFITPSLLLGDADAAMDVPLLCSMGVTHVLNASDTDLGMDREYEIASINYLQLDARDEIGYDMREHLAVAYAFLDSARSGVTLCHCISGINRSAFIVVCDLMAHAEYELLDAIRIVKQARGTVLLNQAFQVQLLDVARAKGLLGNLPPLVESTDCP